MHSSSRFPEHLLKQLEEGQNLRKQGYRGRYAPSPTGSLHLGNLRTALVSWLRARLCQGVWLLRIDDLDMPRNRSGAVESIQNDLLWLGLNWDGPVIYQRQRRGLYSSVLSYLRRQGKLYACRCSRRLLAETSRPGVADRQIIYPGTCRNLNLPWGVQDQRLPSWRLRVNKEFSTTCGDVLLRRADGYVAYHLATVVDELMLGISEVVRGADLINALSSQLAVKDALDKSPVNYKHVPIFCDSQGRKLAKRDGSKGLDMLKDKGMDASKVVGLLAGGLGLVPLGSQLSAVELFGELTNNTDLIDRVLGPSSSLVELAINQKSS